MKPINALVAYPRDNKEDLVEIKIKNAELSYVLLFNAYRAFRKEINEKNWAGAITISLLNGENVVATWVEYHNLLPNNDDKLATKYLRAIEDQQEAEWKLELFFHKLFDIKEENRDQFIIVSADTYDWSLEIGLHGVDYKDFVLTPEQTQKILDLGCARFWINFYTYDSSKKLAEIFSESGKMKVFEYLFE